MVKVLDQKGELHIFQAGYVSFDVAHSNKGTYHVQAYVLAGVASLHGVGDPYYDTITLAEYGTLEEARAAIRRIANAKPGELVDLMEVEK